MIIQIDVNLMLRLLCTRTLSFYKCTIYPATSVPRRCISVHQTDAFFCWESVSLIYGDFQGIGRIYRFTLIQ